MLLNKKEFAERCEIKTKVLSVYIQRRKVILNEEDLIDDQNAINLQFYTHCQKLAASKPKPSESVKSSDSPTPMSETSEPKPKKAKEKNNPDRFDKKFDLDTAKTEAAVIKLKHESALLQMKTDKQLGKLIPTDLIRNLFVQHFRSMQMSFKQGVDILLAEFGKKARLNRNDMAELKGAMIKIINEAQSKGVDESAKNVRNIVMEYSQKKD